MCGCLRGVSKLFISLACGRGETEMSLPSSHMASIYGYFHTAYSGLCCPGGDTPGHKAHHDHVASAPFMCPCQVEEGSNISICMLP